MIYPYVLDVNFKKLSILQNVFNCYLHKEVNKLNKFYFDIPADDPKVKDITGQNYIMIKDQIYSIDFTDIKRTEKNEKTLHVEGNHLFYRLYDFYWESDDEVTNYMPNVTATDVLQRLLVGTPYNLVNCTVDTRTDFLIDKGSIIKNINKVIQKFGGELAIDNYNISLITMIGNNNNSQFRYKKNNRSIQKTQDFGGVITRLYVYGKDGLTIEGVNAGKKYLDSQYLSNYTHIRIGEVTYKDVTDPNELLEKGQKYLSEKEVPLTSYSVNILDLQKQNKENPFDLGDTVHVIDTELGIKIKARVMQYKEYIKPEEAHKSSVVIGNVRPSMTDFYLKYENSSSITDKITTDKYNVNTKVLEGAINTLKNKMVASGAYANAEVLTDGGCLFENTDPTSQDYGALYIGPGIFSIASDKINGDWNWRTFGTGKGFTADEILTGVLKAIDILGGSIRIGDIGNNNYNFEVDTYGNMNARSGTFSGDIYGSHFTGGSIDIGSNFSVDTYGNMYAVDGTFEGEIYGSSITGGTITGSVIKTSSSGRRVVLEKEGLRGYNSDNNLHGLVIPMNSDLWEKDIEIQLYADGYNSGTFSCGYGGMNIYSEGTLQIGRLRGTTYFEGYNRFKDSVHFDSVPNTDYGVLATINDIPDTSSYATKTWVYSKDYATHQNVDDLQAYTEQLIQAVQDWANAKFVQK